MFPMVQHHLAIAADALNLIDQKILQSRNLRCLAADAHFRAAFAVGGLLALVAEHLIIQIHVIAHIHTSWCFLYTVSHPYSFY